MPDPVFLPAKFQSTLPRGERRHTSYADAALPLISIHAPTRGATCCTLDKGILQYISIHAPTRGATHWRGGMSCWRIFQSTLPRGERHDMDIVKTLPTVISIHAPTRGATAYILEAIKAKIFQSTLPRGERREA